HAEALQLLGTVLVAAEGLNLFLEAPVKAFFLLGSVVLCVTGAEAIYADKDKLAASVKALRLKDWGALHEQRSRQYRPENPDLPTLEAWRNRTNPPAERFVFERNPFYHRVDERGMQLPYIDRIVLNTATAALIPAKVGAGDSDLQARYLQFENYTFLKVAAKRRDFTVKLWERAEARA
ncbi:MAG: hypothetical protein HC794_06005, partial [Nitrospiraceae bacterium]|nr:hypothetical protein [Nitrospiraceae bacterium]